MTDASSGWQCSDYLRAAKAVFACARRVATLQQQLNAALADLGAHLSALYGADAPARAAACEACVAPVVGEACAALKRGEHLRPADAFARAWTDAERWLTDAARTLRGATTTSGSGSSGSGSGSSSGSLCGGGADMPDDAERVFFEQRYDGLDGAACAFVRAVLAALAPGSVAACTLRRHLAATLRAAAADAPPAAALAAADTGVAALLRTRAGAQYLRMFLAAQMREESLDFCRAVLALEDAAAAAGAGADNINSNSSDDDAACLAQEIVARFVAPSAPQQINVSGATRVALGAAARRVPPDVGAFGEARDELVQALQCDGTLRQFRASPYYRRLRRRLTPAPWAPRRLALPPPPPPPLATVGAAACGGGDAAVPLSSPTTPVTPESVLGQPQQLPQRPQDPRALGAPSMDDIVQTPALARSFREFLRERGADRPLAFRQAVESLLRRHAPPSSSADGGSSGSSGGCSGGGSSSNSNGSSNSSESGSGSGSGSGSSGLRAGAARLYEEYLVPRAGDVPLGVPHALRCALYGALYDGDAAAGDGACAALLREAAAAALHTLGATEHPRYVLSERWRPLWTAPVAPATAPPPRARSRSVAAPSADPSGSVRTRTASLAGTSACAAAPAAAAALVPPPPPPQSDARPAEDSSGNSKEDDDGDCASAEYLESLATLAARLQTRFVPALQRVASSVKTVARAADLAPHQGEVRALLGVLRALGGVAGPAALRVPDFASVAAVYAHDAELAQFMVRVHRGVWEVTAKVAAVIRALEKAAAAHRADARRLAHYWRLYDQIYALVAPAAAAAAGATAVPQAHQP